MHFEDYLLNGIPLAEAADFFIRVRDGEKIAQMEARVFYKAAEGEMAGAGAAPLPPTARGQNMQPQSPVALPPTAMGDQSASRPKMASDKSPEVLGRERARASLSAEFEKERAHRGEAFGDLLGRTIGTAVGAALLHNYGKSDALATLGGAALGGHVGSKAGRLAGSELDRRRHEKSASVRKLSAAFKLALDETGIAPEMNPGLDPGVTPALDPATTQYVLAEHAARQAEQQGEAAFLKQKLQEAQSAQQAMEQQAQAVQQQLAQAQQAQQAQDQQLQQYQAQVADATQRTSQAQDQILQQQQQAAALRMAFQQLRGTLLQAASAEPPAQALAPNAGTPPAAEAPTADAPTASAGPAGAAPAPGLAPNSAPPMGDDAANAPAAGAQPSMANAAPASAMGQQGPTGGAKLSHVYPRTKTATLRDTFQAMFRENAHRLPYAAGGAAIGGGLGLVESKMDNEPLREKVRALEAKEDRGFRDALNLAQARARLTMGEFAETHPKTTMGVSALGGAFVGATQGPESVRSIRNTVEHLRNAAKGT